MKDVSLVITSCGRFDLLEKTLDSFFRYNTYPIKKVIITEDSTEGKKLEKLVSKYKNQDFKLIINERVFYTQYALQKDLQKKSF